jgi:hypothetical protein
MIRSTPFLFLALCLAMDRVAGLLDASFDKVFGGGENLKDLKHKEATRR